MLVFFSGGLVGVSLIGWLFGEGDWWVCTAGYLALMPPTCLVWELIERRYDQQEQQVNDSTENELPKVDKRRSWRVTIEVRAEAVVAATGSEAIEKVARAIRETTDFWDGRIVAVRATEALGFWANDD